MHWTNIILLLEIYSQYNIPPASREDWKAIIQQKLGMDNTV